MYNRYIPQSDGSYRKSQMQDKPPKLQQPRPQPKPEPPCQMPERTPPVHPPCADPPPRKEPPKPAPPPCSDGNALSFLRQLLPKNLDTGDLLVIILLLLMAGDCKEDQNFALLTLAIYLFL